MVTIREVLLGLLGVLTLGRIRRAVALTLVGAVAVGVVFPPPALAQLGVVAVIGAANAVLRTINGLIRGLLDSANGLLGDISGLIGAFRQLMENVVYPQHLIDQARGMIKSMMGTFRGLLSSLLNINVASAQLPNPVVLEGIIRNRSTTDFGLLSDAYMRTYGALPPPTDAAPMDRDLIDMDDATAKTILKTLKEADAISDRTIAASLAMEDEASITAPGTAEYIVAAGLIAAVQNQAVMQKMIAAEMRQEAARLAHQNMMLKRNAMFSRQSRQDMGTMLTNR